jgi:glucose-6-phosphate 1-dehydrogenase
MSPLSTVVSKVFTKQEMCLLQEMPESCGLVIFGASGDLANRRLFPSLFELVQENLMPKNFYILGVGRTALSDGAFQAKVREGLGAVGSPAERDAFISRFTYLIGDYQAASTYVALQKRMGGLDLVYDTQGRHVFYLSTPPSVYAAVVAQLGSAGMASPSRPESWVRLVVEKPFGRDLNSAQALNRTIQKVFREDQIYRIDHYLGKETVQNILMFRFANAIYEPIWSQKYIDHVQITAAETVGVEHRAGYYEQAGALRDMFQNHLLQLLCLVAMEPPASFGADAVRNEKTKVMAALELPCGAGCARDAVRGQYAAGVVEEERVSAYREEPGVPASSVTETYVALRVGIDNWRWHGVPFYLRSGKRLPSRVTEIAVEFKRVPTSIFKPLMADALSPNVLNFRIQPNEGISLRFEAKHPGPKLCMSSVTMQFDYEEAFGIRPPEAYARLFLDIMLGDQTLFARQDWQELSWKLLDPLLSFWTEQKEKGLYFYPAGSWGPPEAEALLTRDGRNWLTA